MEVSANGREGLVLTCWHVFREGYGQIVVQCSDGRTHGARVVAVDQSADLAALVIANPRVSPAQFSYQPVQQDRLRACGYGQSGRYRCISGPSLGVSEQSGQTSLLVQGAVRSGDSGGGVFNQRGELVAVVWGHREGVTYASGGRPLRTFLSRVLGRRPQVVVNCPNGLCPRPQVPDLASPQEPQSPAPAEPEGSEHSIVVDRRLRELAAAIERLEQEKQQVGEYATRRDLADSESTVLQRLEPLLSRGSSGLGKHAGKTAAAVLGLTGPLGWAVVAAGTLGGWLVGRRMKRKLRGARGRRRPFRSAGSVRQ